MKVSFLITGLQHAAILDHDAKPARKMKRPQKPLHGCGKHFGGAHLAAKLAKVVFLILSIPNVQHKQFPHLPPHSVMTRGPSYSSHFSEVKDSISFKMFVIVEK